MSAHMQSHVLLFTVITITMLPQEPV